MVLINREGNEFRQFRFVTGSPDKEAKFKTALEKQLPPNPKYPTIFVRSCQMTTCPYSTDFYTGFPWFSCKQLAFGIYTCLLIDGSVIDDLV